MNLKGIGVNTMNWVDSAQDKDYWRVLVNTALNHCISHGVIIIIISFVIREKMNIRILF